MDRAAREAGDGQPPRRGVRALVVAVQQARWHCRRQRGRARGAVPRLLLESRHAGSNGRRATRTAPGQSQGCLASGFRGPVEARRRLHRTKRHRQGARRVRTRGRRQSDARQQPALPPRGHLRGERRAAATVDLRRTAGDHPPPIVREPAGARSAPGVRTGPAAVATTPGRRRAAPTREGARPTSSARRSSGEGMRSAWLCSGAKARQSP